MATRTSIRPRPVDISRQLNIVRDVAELDNTDDLDAAQTQAPAAAFEQAPPAGPQKKKKEVKEIPVPEVRIVPGYTREYLPLFRIPETYIRGKGGVGWAREDYCEYDLDNEDEDWLEGFNAGGANRLSEEKFEQMLWRLETANAEANQRLMSEPGYATDWRLLPAAVAATGNMSRDEALSVLRKNACARDPILHSVYDYWRAKRERWGKPIMRRLQAPTNPSDTNPYNVFRPRERVNRPQTRRRRENTQDCLDKMRQIRESMLKSLEMTELLTFREARKRDIHRIDVDLQRYQVARHHHLRHQLEAIEAEAASQLQEAQARSRQGESRLRAYLDSANSLGASTTSYDSPLRRALLRKRRRQEMEGCVNGEAVARLPPPPLLPDDEILLLYSPDLSRLLGQPPQPQAAASALLMNGNGAAGGGGKAPLVAVPSGLDLRCVQTRISRCGRTMLTRCDPLTLEPHPPAAAAAVAAAGADGAVAGTAQAAGAAAAPPSAVAARHPLLLASQVPTLPWAACLDLELLPEGIADKAALRAQRERRINADRLNAAMLRQTQQTLHTQAAGGMVGAASVAGAAAAAAAAAATAATAGAAAAAAAPPTAAAAAAGTPAPPSTRPPPPPPPAAANQGAPAGTLPHVPPPAAPAGTLAHVPPPGSATTAAAPPPAAVAAAAPGVGGALAAGGSGPPGAVGGAAPPQQAPGSAGAQARKSLGGAATASTPTPAAATPVGGPGPVAASTSHPAPAPAPAAATPGTAPPGGTAAAAAAPTAGPAALGGSATGPAGAGAGPGLGSGAAGASGAATATAAPAAAAPVSSASAGAAGVGAAVPAAPALLASTPGGGGAGGGGGGGATPGSGPTVKKMLSTSKAVAGPSSASQLKRGPGRPPKAAKANGDGPPTNTTVPMDML